MIARRAVRILLFYGALSLLISCAKVGAPPGGPEDRQGPRLTGSVPANNAIQVPRKLTARLEFSETVNRASVTSALFLSPDPGQRLRYRWGERSLELVYLDSLAEDRTYVISVGSQAKDIRGNPAGESFTIAFSTGDVIDRGRIEGWIGDMDTPQAVSLWAYRLEDDPHPDVLRRPAAYRIQAGSDARFRFEYLRAGTYRVFGVTDRNLDGLWSPLAEWIGVPPWDVTVTDTTVPWISFKPAQFDTAGVRIRSARTVTSGRFDLRLTRGAAALQAELLTPSGAAIPVFESLPDTAAPDLWSVFVDPPAATDTILCVAAGLDLFGHSWRDSTASLLSSRPDTARPRIQSTEPLAYRRVADVPPHFRFRFDEPVRLDTARAGFVVTRSDSDTVVVRIAPAVSVMDVVIDPPPAAGARYMVRFDGRGVADYTGNTVADTTLEYSFQIFPRDSLGSVHGRIISAHSGPYAIRVLNPRDHRQVAGAIADDAAAFVVADLQPGSYLIEVVRDLDKSGGYSYGSVVPFAFSEPVVLSPDTVTVRARWAYDTAIAFPDNP